MRTRIESMSAVRRPTLASVACACLSALALALGAAPACAAPPTEFGEQGSGPGQFSEPTGIAIDQASRDVYLMDRDNLRVDEFTSEGQFLRDWVGPAYPHGNGVIAVDNATGNPLDTSVGDVYAADTRNNQILKFGPDGESLPTFSEGSSVAVGPTGTVYIGNGGEVEELSPEGVHQATVLLEGATEVVGSLTVGPSGELYVISGGDFAGTSLKEYSESGELLRTLLLLPEEGLGGMTLGESGELFVNVRSNSISRIVEFNAAGVELSSFDSGSEYMEGIAFGDAISRLYTVTDKAVRLVAVPPLGPEIDSESVNAIEPTSATVQARIDPENHGTKYRFEYGKSESYGSSVPLPEGALSASFEEEPVEVPLTKLTAGVTYHYRVVATDSEGHVTTGKDQTFNTLPAVSVDSEYATSVSATSVTFGAQLNPLGVSATYRVEYGTSAEYGKTALEAPLSAVFGDVGVSAHVDGLSPDTLYHYRVVAYDEREGVHYTLEGPDETFTTQHLGGPLALPDGRAWELVSPQEAHGAYFPGLPYPAQEFPSILSQASVSGDAVTYATDLPTEANPHGFLLSLQVLSRHGANGWSSVDLTTPNETPGGFNLNEVEFPLFSEDLSAAVMEQFAPSSPLLSPLATERTPYLYRPSACESQPSANECYTPLITGKEGIADVPAGTRFEYPKRELDLEGATGDLNHVVFSYEQDKGRELGIYGDEEEATSLTETHAPVGGLYEWSPDNPPAHRLQLVSILPDGVAPPEAFLGGVSRIALFNGEEEYSKGAISEDGARVFWTVPGEGRDNAVYMRDLSKGEKGETLQIGEPEAGKTESGAVTYQSATSDGSDVFFTDSGRLTENAGNNDFYECEIIEVAGKLKCKLTDLMPGGGSTPLQLGSTADGSYVYFTTPNDNLYVRHEGVNKLVAEEVQPGDNYTEEPKGDEGSWQIKTIRMSPSGQFVAFTSHKSLTGYDNLDLTTGEPDSEVYVYDAQREHLACASCNPSGGRPQLGGGWVPGWTTRHHQSAYLSDSGRLFFDTNEALVPQDINGTTDVYEWEPQGVGSCTSASSTFSVASGGCAALISSGTSSEESTFLDASESGDDVFFLTLEKLVPQDTDTAVDVYDAHVCSSGWPCVSAPVSAPECTTTDACRAAPLPQPTLFGAPASATFSGAGNVTPVPPPVVKGKGKSAAQIRAEKLAKALRACARKPKRKRAACRESARARYATRHGRVGR
jgi:hypothetical protein